MIYCRQLPITKGHGSAETASTLNLIWHLQEKLRIARADRSTRAGIPRFDSSASCTTCQRTKDATRPQFQLKTRSLRVMALRRAQEEGIELAQPCIARHMGTIAQSCILLLHLEPFDHRQHEQAKCKDRCRLVRGAADASFPRPKV